MADTVPSPLSPVQVPKDDVGQIADGSSAPIQQENITTDGDFVDMAPVEDMDVSEVTQII